MSLLDASNQIQTALDKKVQDLALLQLEINDLKKQLTESKENEKQFRKETGIDKNREKNLRQAIGKPVYPPGVSSNREVIIYIPTDSMTPKLRDFLLSLRKDNYGQNHGWYSYDDTAMVCKFYADDSTRYKSRYLSKHCKFNALLPILKHNNIPYCYFSHTLYTRRRRIIYHNSFPFEKVPESIFDKDDDDYYDDYDPYDDFPIDDCECSFGCYCPD